MSQKKPRLFVTSFVMLLEAMARDIISLGHLHDAVFYFKPFPLNYILYPEDQALGAFFFSNQALGRKTHQLALPFFKLAESQGRILCADRNPEGFWGHVRGLQELAIEIFKDNHPPVEEMGKIVRTAPALMAGNVLTVAKEFMREGKLIIIGGGVSLDEVAALLK